MLTATFLAYEKELEANIDHVFYLEPKLSLYVGVFSNSPYHDFGCIYLQFKITGKTKHQVTSELGFEQNRTRFETMLSHIQVHAAFQIDEIILGRNARYIV